jgi:hypothetical protein
VTVASLRSGPVGLFPRLKTAISPKKTVNTHVTLTHATCIHAHMQWLVFLPARRYYWPSPEDRDVVLDRYLDALFKVRPGVPDRTPSASVGRESHVASLAHAHAHARTPPHPAQAFGKPREGEPAAMPQKKHSMFGKTKGGASREPSGALAPTHEAGGGKEWTLGAVAETEGAGGGGGDSPFAGGGQPQPRSDAAL